MLRSARLSHPRGIASVGLAAALVAALSLTGSCKKGAGDSETEEPGSVDALTAEAAALPGFDIEGGTPGKARDDVPHERFYVLLGDSPVRGPANASVTMVAFSDFECPYCERGHQTVQQLMEEYKGDLRVAYKAFPLEFHPHAMIAALAARTAQSQGKFWEFHDLLLSQRGLDMDRIVEYAREVDLDLELLGADIDSLKYGVAVKREMRQARRLGVRGTPAYFINGRMLGGARPIQEMRAIIDEEIALAEKWRAKGVPANRVYAYAIQDGYRAVEYEKKSRDLSTDTVYNVPLGTSPRRGPDDAPITIVEFGDFECPFCARGNDTLERVRKRYGGKVRVVYKHLPLPFHANAYVAARGAVAAQEQGKFWEYHDAVYETRAKFDEGTLISIAKGIGMDVRRFKQEIQSDVHDPMVASDMELARTIGIRGTPAYFINGRALPGAVPEMEFRIVVMEELERAEAALAKGVAPRDLYEHLITTPATLE